MEHTFDHEYWDRVWQGDRGAAMGAAEPNPHLVREVGDLTPGTALDAGSGAGAEAIWLASRGWRVTGADIAAAALDRAAERAAVAGVADEVTWVRADLSVWEPGTLFDLVTTHYAHPAMVQLDFYERTASWVAPGGTLLVVGHLHQDAGAERHGHGPDHGPDHGHGHGHGPGHGHADGPADATGDERDGPPASASATAATITARLDPATWEVVTALESPREHVGPGGRTVTIHDVVVRATRRR